MIQNGVQALEHRLASQVELLQQNPVSVLESLQKHTVLPFEAHALGVMNNDIYIINKPIILKRILSIFNFILYFYKT